MSAELIRALEPAGGIGGGGGGGGGKGEGSALREGMKVEARYRGKARYYPGIIKREVSRGKGKTRQRVGVKKKQKGRS